MVLGGVDQVEGLEGMVGVEGVEGMCEVELCLGFILRFV